MDDERARRIGANEALFRAVNERIQDLNEAFGPLAETMTIVCECGDASCTQQIPLSPADYERIRSDPTLFVAVPGHELPDVETVVERGDGYVVVRKHPGEAERVARATDPRS